MFKALTHTHSRLCFLFLFRPQKQLAILFLFLAVALVLEGRSGGDKRSGSIWIATSPFFFSLSLSLRPRCWRATRGDLGKMLDVSRVQKELMECNRDKSISGVSISLADGGTDLSHLLGTISGPVDTPYEGGTFVIDIRLTSTIASCLFFFYFLFPFSVGRNLAFRHAYLWVLKRLYDVETGTIGIAAAPLSFFVCPTFVSLSLFWKWEDWLETDQKMIICKGKKKKWNGAFLVELWFYGFPWNEKKMEKMVEET